LLSSLYSVYTSFFYWKNVQVCSRASSMLTLGTWTPWNYQFFVLFMFSSFQEPKNEKKRKAMTRAVTCIHYFMLWSFFTISFFLALLPISDFTKASIIFFISLAPSCQGVLKWEFWHFFASLWQKLPDLTDFCYNKAKKCQNSHLKKIFAQRGP